MRGWKCSALKGILRFWEQLVETNCDWPLKELSYAWTFIKQLVTYRSQDSRGPWQGPPGLSKNLVLGSGHSIAHSPPDPVLSFRKKKNKRCEFEKNKTSRIKDVEKRCKKWGSCWRDFGGSKLFLFTLICLASFFILLLLFYLHYASSVFLFKCVSSSVSGQHVYLKKVPHSYEESFFVLC